VTNIKICGLSEVQHALAVAEAGADFVGMVFAESKRQISVEKAMEIAKAVHAFKSDQLVVGVFANSAADEVNRIAGYCHLDWVQLSGDENWHYCQNIDRPIIKVIHVSNASTPEEIVSEISAGYQLLPEKSLLCLLDSKAGESYGGTGKTFDWRLAREVAAKFPVIVDVGKMVQEIQPWGVDVSSGVETDGQKDVTKIKLFIQAVRSVYK
jgi:phosphoribosylanthranilate isomerase